MQSSKGMMWLGLISCIFVCKGGADLRFRPDHAAIGDGTSVTRHVLLATNETSSEGAENVLVATMPPSRQTVSPNIILINLDDADDQLFRSPLAKHQFPHIMQHVSRRGITFTNLHVTTPMCGPSRACLYRGQYAHNTGIRVNDPTVPASHHFGGGFQQYREKGYFEDDLGVWMKRAGYRTMLVGKFLHHEFQPYVPPGWDDFCSSQGDRYFGTLLFTNQTQSTGSWVELPADRYRTDEEADRAVSYLRQHNQRNPSQPFFLNVNPFGPHRGSKSDPAIFAARYHNWWPDLRPEKTPDFLETDWSDKRGPFREFGPTPEWIFEFADVHHRERVLATKCVDDLVGKILHTLCELNLEHNTYVFVTSDNGYSLGHFRMIGKGTPVERSSRVPLMVVGPTVSPGRTAHHLLGHIDLAPTIVELGGGQVPDFVDGKSFAPLLKNSDSIPVDRWRKNLLIENWESTYGQSGLVEWASTTLRTIDSVYTEWANGDRDYFDLANDPYQLSNVYDELSDDRRKALRGALRALRDDEPLAQGKFSVPFARHERIETGTHLRGYAEHPLGVRQVRLTIRDIQGDRYWNGSDWLDESCHLDATVENVDGQITRWNYQLTIPPEKIPRGRCVARVWAYDATGKYDQPAIARFTVVRPKVPAVEMPKTNGIASPQQ